VRKRTRFPLTSPQGDRFAMDFGGGLLRFPLASGVKDHNHTSWQFALM
jgi:hypothetical protein